MTKKSDAPAIRFKGFSDAWEQRKLGELVDRVVRKNTNNESTLPLTISAQYGLVDQITYFNNRVASRDVSNYYLVLNGEFAYNKSTSDGYPFGAVKRLDLYEKGVLSTLYIVFAPKKEQQIDSDYLTVFFDTDRWHKGVAERAAEGARNHGLLNISAEDFFDIDLSVPKDIVEQKQIGAFIRQLDNLITLHQRKFEKLTNVKKSMLEKMFPQNGSSYPEIRFKGFTDPWEQRKLTEFVESFSGLTYTPNDVQENGTLVLRSSNVSNGEVVDADNVYVNPQVVNSENVKVGDIVVVVRNGSRSLIGKHAQIKAFMPNTVIGAFMTGIRSECPEFTNALLNTSRFEEEIAMNMGATINQITGYMFSKMEFKVPCLDEQKKIGEYFEKLDRLITLHQRQPFLHSPPDISLIVQLTPPFYTFSWEQRKWINTVDISTNMVDPKSGKYDLLPHVAPGNIESFTGRLYDNVKLVGEENLISGKFVFNVGDIVYGKINPQLGKYVFARFSGLTSADAYVLNAKNGIVQKFLYAVIQTRDFYDYSVSVSKRSGMPKINRDELNAYSYWAPSESEQLKIGEYLLTLDHLITLHQRQTIVYAVIRSIRKVILAERQYFAPPMVRKSP